jgi:hypothetical protein
MTRAGEHNDGNIKMRNILMKVYGADFDFCLEFEDIIFMWILNLV